MQGRPKVQKSWIWNNWSLVKVKTDLFLFVERLNPSVHGADAIQTLDLLCSAASLPQGGVEALHHLGFHSFCRWTSEPQTCHFCAKASAFKPPAPSLYVLFFISFILEAEILMSKSPVELLEHHDSMRKLNLLCLNILDSMMCLCCRIHELIRQKSSSTHEGMQAFWIFYVWLQELLRLPWRKETSSGQWDHFLKTLRPHMNTNQQTLNWPGVCSWTHVSRTWNFCPRFRSKASCWGSTCHSSVP